MVGTKRRIRAGGRTCALVVTMMALGFDAGAVQFQTGNRTVWDGVYSNPQLERGREAFRSNCSGCHAEDLSGGNGPALNGEFFMDRWRQFELSTLYTVVRDNMPPSRARSGIQTLTDGTYLDILTVIMEGNGFPVGSGELTPEMLDEVWIIAEGGPLSLPGNSLVRVVGCLAQEADGSWLLTRATEPVRAKPESIDYASADELQAAADAPSGELTFRLANLDYLGPDYSPVANRGNTMQGKGLLIRQPERERINVTSLEPVAVGCR